MKKVLFTAVAAMAFAFAMTACNNNQPAEATEEVSEKACEEGKECCKKAEGKECEHKCQK